MLVSVLRGVLFLFIVFLRFVDAVEMVDSTEEQLSLWVFVLVLNCAVSSWMVFVNLVICWACSSSFAINFSFWHFDLSSSCLSSLWWR